MFTILSGSGQSAVLILFWGGATSSHLNSLGSIQWCCLTWCTLLCSHSPSWLVFYLTLEELEILQLGMNSTVHRWSLMCTSCIEMTAHTPAFFTRLSTTHRHAWNSHLASECQVASQLAALRLEPTMCRFRAPCAIHSATTSPWLYDIWLQRDTAPHHVTLHRHTSMSQSEWAKKLSH